MNETQLLLGKLLSEQVKQYSVDTPINEVEFGAYSQFGEDGIIQFIVHHLGDTIKHKVFIDIGVEDYTEANTRFLLENNTWRGAVIDCCEDSIKKFRRAAFFGVIIYLR